MNIPGARPGDVVQASAAAIDRARAAGLPDDVIATLLHARRAWWSERTPDAEHAPWPDRPDLARAIAHPLASSFDEVLVAHIRRRLRA